MKVHGLKTSPGVPIDATCIVGPWRSNQQTAGWPSARCASTQVVKTMSQKRGSSGRLGRVGFRHGSALLPSLRLQAPLASVVAGEPPLGPTPPRSPLDC